MLPISANKQIVELDVLEFQNARLIVLTGWIDELLKVLKTAWASARLLADQKSIDLFASFCRFHCFKTRLALAVKGSSAASLGLNHFQLSSPEGSLSSSSAVKQCS